MTRHNNPVRNVALMNWRNEQRRAERQLMLLVNSEWFERAWQTPDMAMCLGRHGQYEPIGDGSWRHWPPTID